MAARQGPVAMAAHQICIPVWLAVSLLVDALGASAQVLSLSLTYIACYNVLILLKLPLFWTTSFGKVLLIIIVFFCSYWSIIEGYFSFKSVEISLCIVSVCT